MNKTAIEWTDYTWNPVTGCLNNCSYCYARRIAERFKGTKAWPNGFEPMYHEERLYEPFKVKQPSKIFVCSMGELFGDWWVDADVTSPLRLESYTHYLSLRDAIIDVVKMNPQHTFQFLTKCPENLSKFNPWPENAWVGVTIDGTKPVKNMRDILWNVEAKTRFISFEPLKGSVFVKYGFAHIDWLIIGAQTNPYKPPKQEWVQEIIDAADKAGLPVFIKDNLHWSIPRREWPEALRAKSEAFNHEVCRLPQSVV